MPPKVLEQIRMGFKKPQPKKRDELSLEDIRNLANELTCAIGEKVEIDMADEEAIYDDMKTLLTKYLVD